MKAITQLLVFSGLLALVWWVVGQVLASNLRSGVYPINADSIGIPLAETTHISAVAACLLLVVAGLSALSRATKLAEHPRLFAFVAGLLAISYILAAAFFALWGFSWLTPHHYWIVASCAAVVVALVWYGVFDWRSLRPNNSSKPTPLRGAA